MITPAPTSNALGIPTNMSFTPMVNGRSAALGASSSTIFCGEIDADRCCANTAEQHDRYGAVVRRHEQHAAEDRRQQT
jgi:hypothetical protein